MVESAVGYHPHRQSSVQLHGSHDEGKETKISICDKWTHNRRWPQPINRIAVRLRSTQSFTRRILDLQVDHGTETSAVRRTRSAANTVKHSNVVPVCRTVKQNPGRGLMLLGYTIQRIFLRLPLSRTSWNGESFLVFDRWSQSTRTGMHPFCRRITWPVHQDEGRWVVEANCFFYTDQ